MSSDDGVVQEPHEGRDFRVCHWKFHDGAGAADGVVHRSCVDDEELAIVSHRLIG